MSTIWKFKNRENKHDVCRGKGCIKKFCESLREHAMKEINFKKKNEVINERAAGIIWNTQKSVTDRNHMKYAKICYR